MCCRWLSAARARLPAAVAGIVMASLLLAAPSRAWTQDGDLGTIREDVRQGPPPESPRPEPPPPKPPPPKKEPPIVSEGHPPRFFENDDGLDFMGCLVIAGAVATSPIWCPMVLLGDDYSQGGRFPYSPYDGTSGYIIRDYSPNPRLWSARLDAEYANDFDGLDRLGGHLLLDTASRFGLDAEASQLEERLPGGRRDALWLGDANLVFRFAQSERAEFRTGLGVNWLDDAQGDDLGFNFTYGADLFPRKPWVVSSTVDVGTLGHAGLLRVRTTGGVVFHGVEVYTGYEYLDIERTHSSSLLAGLRFWF
jgi:hypothetical protein